MNTSGCANDRHSSITHSLLQISPTVKGVVGAVPFSNHRGRYSEKTLGVGWAELVYVLWLVDGMGREITEEEVIQKLSGENANQGHVLSLTY